MTVIRTFHPGRVAEAAAEAGATLRSRLPATLDAVRLMRAIAEVESGFGRNCTPRHERAYDLGGKLYEAKSSGGRALRELRVEWGAWMACSYGPWQTMYSLARELGFHVEPFELATSVNLNATVAATYILKRIVPEIPTGTGEQRALEIVGDAYNSGTSRDGFVPVEYLEKLARAYVKHAGPVA